MKKRIIGIIIIILLTTGCTCEYNLTINNGKYNEEIIITAQNQNEVSSLNEEWLIPISKDNYGIVQEVPSKVDDWDYYNYEINQNNLTFNYELSQEEIRNSSAVSTCFKVLNVSSYEGNIIISTNTGATCFNKNPSLSKLIVNIKTDKKVTSNNADYNNENTYSWVITKSNVENRSINMIISQLDNSSGQSSSSIDPIEPTKKNDKKSSNDYTMYIFAGILLVVMLIGYAIFKKIKNKSKMDD